MKEMNQQFGFTIKKIIKQLDKNAVGEKLFNQLTNHLAEIFGDIKT